RHGSSPLPRSGARQPRAPAEARAVAFQEPFDHPGPDRAPGAEPRLDEAVRREGGAGVPPEDAARGGHEPHRTAPVARPGAGGREAGARSSPEAGRRDSPRPPGAGDEPRRTDSAGPHRGTRSHPRPAPGLEPDGLEGPAPEP